MNRDELTKLLTEHAPELTAEASEALTEALSAEIQREGDRRATAASKTAIASYERKHQLREGKPLAPTDPPTEGDPQPTPQPDAEPEWAAALRAEVHQMRRAEQTKARTETLERLIEPLPEGLRSAYLRTSFGELTQEEFDRLTDTIGQEVQSTLQSINLAQASRRTLQPLPSPTANTASAEEIEALARVTPALGKL